MGKTIRALAAAALSLGAVIGAIKDAQDDAAYYCAEGTEYYDMAKCANAKAAETELKKQDAALDAIYYCAEGTEYYDMAKCADAIERAGDAYKPDAGPQNPDEGEGPQSDGATADPAPQSGASSAPAPSGSAGAGLLAKTGAVAAVVVGAAGALAAAGAGLVALRKRA